LTEVIALVLRAVGSQATIVPACGDNYERQMIQELNTNYTSDFFSFRQSRGVPELSGVMHCSAALTARAIFVPANVDSY
jgi:hypothetical protein